MSRRIGKRCVYYIQSTWRSPFSLDLMPSEEALMNLLFHIRLKRMTCEKSLGLDSNRHCLRAVLILS